MHKSQMHKDTQKHAPYAVFPVTKYPTWSPQNGVIFQSVDNLCVKYIEKTPNTETVPA
jgi:hypothetical protein